MKITGKQKINLMNCLKFVAIAIEQEDQDMLRSYYEQLNDLVIEVMEE